MPPTLLSFIILWITCPFVYQLGQSWVGFSPGKLILYLGFVMPAKALMPTMLVQEHKDKTNTHTVHDVLTWFGQPYLRPRMRENDSTIQQRILQRTEPDTTIGFLKHSMFPHSLYPYLTTSPLTPPGTFRSSSYLYPPRIVFTGPSPSHNFFPT